MKVLIRLLVITSGIMFTTSAMAKSKAKNKVKIKPPEHTETWNNDTADNGRNPNYNSELPYSPDEMDKNSKENYSTKNMPVDQD